MLNHLIPFSNGIYTIPKADITAPKNSLIAHKIVPLKNIVAVNTAIVIERILLKGILLVSKVAHSGFKNCF